MLGLLVKEIIRNVNNATICSGNCENCNHFIDDYCFLERHYAPVFQAKNNHLYSTTLPYLDGKVDIKLEMPLSLFHQITRDELHGILEVNHTGEYLKDCIRTKNHVTFQLKGPYRLQVGNNINLSHYESKHCQIKPPFIIGEYTLQYSYRI